VRHTAASFGGFYDWNLATPEPVREAELKKDIIAHAGDVRDDQA